MKVLLSGAAGFIGSYVAQKRVEHGDEVVGFDSLDDHDDVSLEKARLASFMDHPNHTHVHADLANRAAAEAAFATQQSQRVIIRAAQEVGVPHTEADISDFIVSVDYRPQVEEGVTNFVWWNREYQSA